MIIYADSLVSPETFRESRAKVVIKTSNLHIEQINGLVKKYSDEGLDITRLHSGDPAIYGAINDEIEFFNKNGIKYEITPG